MKKLKKYIVLLIMIAASATAIFLPIHIWPKEVYSEYEAVMFRAGEPGYMETVNVEVEGYMNNRLFGGKKFLGKILIDEMPLRDDFKDQTIQIKFNGKGLGMMVYLDDSNGTGDYSFIPEGHIAMNKTGEKIAISFLEGGDTATYVFDGSLMIAGPAATREQAVSVSNMLFDKVLDNPIR